MSLEFRTAGESHGKGCLAILEGLPKGLPVDVEWIDRQLERRQSGHGRSARQRMERDRVELLGGVYRGCCIEAPVCLWIPNRVQGLEDLPELGRPRPGHADLAGCLRHGDRDIRANLERASARETAARVAAGALAQLLLREIGLEVLGHVVRIGEVEVPRERGEGLGSGPELRELRERVEQSSFAVLEPGVEGRMRGAIDSCARQGDSLGGLVEVVAADMPGGLGSFTQWNRKLDGRLAQALLSIPAIKACEIGMGIEAARLTGSQVHDPIRPDPAGGIARPTNNAGGLEAGVSNGEPLVLRAAMKPIATLRRPLPSVDLATGAAAEAAHERADICAVPAASVVGEAMVALVLADACLESFGGTSLEAFRRGHGEHQKRVARVLRKPRQGGGEAP